LLSPGSNRETVYGWGEETLAAMPGIAGVAGAMLFFNQRPYATTPSPRP